MRTRLLALIGVLTLLVTACGAATPTAEPASEGIQVHGDWTLEIYNEDGTLDERHAFSNDLTGSGNSLLLSMLNEQLDVQAHGGTEPWVIFLGAHDLVDPVTLDPVPGPAPCGTEIPQLLTSDIDVLRVRGCVLHDDSPVVVSEVQSITPDGNDVSSYTNSALGSGPFNLQLNGSVVATSGSIDFVSTFVEVTRRSGAVAAETLTSTSVGPYEVESGQTVQVTVEISFS